jgi:hypothetical protein
VTRARRRLLSIALVFWEECLLCRLSLATSMPRRQLQLTVRGGRKVIYEPNTPPPKTTTQRDGSRCVAATIPTHELSILPLQILN